MTPIWRSLQPRPPTVADLVVGFLAYFFTLCLSTDAKAALLRHTIQESDSAESIQTERVCFGLRRVPDRLFCLPFPYLLEDSGRLTIDLTVKANDRAYTIASRVMDNKVDQQLLDELFTEQNFQSASGSATLRAIYRNTSLNFTPLHATVALKIANPSLPEIHIAGMKQSVLRLTHAFVLRPKAIARYGNIAVTPSLFYYERKFAYLDADLVSSSGQKIENLITTEKDKKVDGDVAVSFLSRTIALPTLSLRIDNVRQSQPCVDCEQKFFDIKSPLLTTASASMSFAIPHPIGHSMIGTVLPFFGPFRQFDQLKTTAAYAYRLSKLGCFASFSPLLHTFGFLFDSEVYRLGVLYSSEQYDNAHHIGRLKQTYVFTSFYL